MSMNDDSNDSAAKKFDIDSYWTAVKGRWQRTEEPQRIVEAKVAKSKFKRDLERGQASEHSFFMKYQHCITRTDGRRGDFEINKCGSVLELKSDSYDPNKTPNFFMERYSHGEAPGGVHQSVEHGVQYYIYWYPLTGDTYIFNAKQLLRKLNKVTKAMELIEIRNQGYITRGYLVKRSELEHLCLTPESIGLYAK